MQPCNLRYTVLSDGGRLASQRCQIEKTSTARQSSCEIHNFKNPRTKLTNERSAMLIFEHQSQRCHIFGKNCSTLQPGSVKLNNLKRILIQIIILLIYATENNDNNKILHIYTSYRCLFFNSAILLIIISCS